MRVLRKFWAYMRFVIALFAVGGAVLCLGNVCYFYFTFLYFIKLSIFAADYQLSRI